MTTATKNCCQNCGRRAPLAWRRCKSCRGAYRERLLARAAPKPVREPTAHEIEALVERQRKRLPDWWHEDIEPEKPVEIRVFRVRDMRFAGHLPRE